MKLPALGPGKICRGVHLAGSALRSSVFDSAVYAVTRDSGSVTLIDCGSPFGLTGLEANLRKLGADFSRVDWVLATHCHYDHVGGIAALKRRHPHIRFAIHKLDAPAVAEADSAATCASWMFDEQAEPAEPDLLLSGGETFSTAAGDFEIISMPGHSPGSIAILTDSPDGRVVFTGDCYVPSCDLVGYDFDALSDTWARLLGLDADIICPGHYDHHITHPVIHAMANRPGSSLTRAILLNPQLSRLPSTIGTHIYINGKVPGYLKSLYPLLD